MMQARRPDSDMASVNQLKTQSAQALNTIASTCPSAAKVRMNIVEAV